ncbi:MAG: peptidase S13 [Gammaproteobacteria bacterium]|jgi:D-alanyl-D-alanine carboxypeptidase/D-alanyl-D-alanine-endopeptidase (penicillin-binding protein 4)|nr:peptidase S13 [Gammaproteobacteria bacterium]MBT3858217.1 peptidase S13 [Gammaproteobacteria bacterium]MBT3988657.1 peptidase S13 [Gammaproteobacteria bacterium]MBT4255553.1 peptidase S13 [Gammaproteobacteria bacterium]MBT4657864.1 peptidase S13 [Gammaproteobacteria bacterium]
MKPAAPVLHTFTLSLLLACCALANPVFAQDRLVTLIGDGSVMLHSPDGEELVSLNPDSALVPASVVKIPLAQVALTTLGEDFRFETHFYRNNNGDLLIRGLGDPFLVSEEIALIADVLAERGLEQVRRLVLDDSAFEPNPDLPLEQNSSQPYAARTSALAVNFNTVNLAWTAQGRLISGESQTPLTPLALELGAQLTPGDAQRINLGEEPVAGLQQAAQLFRLFLEESGITVTDTDFYREAVTDEWTLFYRHSSSRSLRDNLDGMLRYSNNFTANQLFLTLGAHSSGYPATVEAARKVLQQQLTVLYGDGFGNEPQSLFMLEGSGLSREQRSSAAGMMRILEVFKPNAELLAETNGVLRKSGTLTGVYNFAGYISGPDGLYPFVILTNQAVNNRAEILRILQGIVN